MKTWKLVSGILSIVLSIFVLFQSCAAGLSNAIEANGEAGGSAGVMVAIMLLVGGIVSIVKSWETGYRCPTLDAVAALCAVLGVTADELIF